MSENNKIVVQLNGVSEYYRVKFNYPDKTIEKEIKALENINLAINKGESLAILGANGAGKTTLLRIIAGIIKPDSGEVKVSGKVRGIFELGAGFISELTGYENIKMVANIYNISSEDIIEKIVEFSELGDFIYAPLRTYSQGMYLRLAFSLAIYTNPDILLIDDILAVGDSHFQKKCINEIQKIISSGKTVIIVTHNFDLAEFLTSRCIMLNKGKILTQGKPQDVKYLFTEISGNIWGIASLENRILNLIFNNGRISLRYKDIPLTLDLGLFASFIKNNSNVFYSTDFSWQVEGKDNRIKCSGYIGKNIVSIIDLKLQDETIYISLESDFNRVELNCMLSDLFKRIQAGGKIIDFPVIPQESFREWHRIGELSSNSIELISEEKEYPVLSFTSSIIESKFELFNFNFNKAARIIKILSNNREINLRIDLFDPVPKLQADLKRNLKLDELVAELNNFLIQSGKIKQTLLKKINFISYIREKALTNYESRLLRYNGITDIEMLIYFPKLKLQFLLALSIKDSEVILRFSSKSKVSQSLAGIGIILPSLYRNYSSEYYDGIISDYQRNNFVTDVFKVRWLKLIPSEKDYSEISLKFSKDTAVEIGQDIYDKESINLKLLYKIDPDDYIVTLSI